MIATVEKSRRLLMLGHQITSKNIKQYQLCRDVRVMIGEEAQNRPKLRITILFVF